MSLVEHFLVAAQLPFYSDTLHVRHFYDFFSDTKFFKAQIIQISSGDFRTHKDVSGPAISQNH